MNKKQMKVKVKDLRQCEWNPRSEEEMLASHPEMEKLVASVRELGVVQPIAVWNDGGDMVVIAGNRRFCAAGYAGIREIEAVVFEGITEAQAREITRVENEVRIGVDPIKDASLIGSMLELGYNQKEIAAHFGVSEATVCRRVKLLDLIPAVREAGVGGRISTDALERIALYPQDTQQKLAKRIAETAQRSAEAGDTAHWRQFQWDFDRETKDLEAVKFDTSACVACMKRTGAQADLWGDVSGKLGRCMDCKCFAAKFEEYKIGIVRKKVGEDVELVSGKGAGMYGIYATKSDENKSIFGKRGKKRPAAWWWFDEYNGDVKTVWGPSREEWDAIVARREEDERAAEELRKNNAKEYELKSKLESGRLSKLNALTRAAQDAFDEIWHVFEEGEGIADIIERTALSELPADQSKPLAALLESAVTSYDVEKTELMAMILAFPKFAKEVGVTAEMLVKLAEAEKAVETFARENPKIV